MVCVVLEPKAIGLNSLAELKPKLEDENEEPKCNNHNPQNNSNNETTSKLWPSMKKRKRIPTETLEAKHNSYTSDTAAAQ